jgi:hypothetical protein
MINLEDRDILQVSGTIIAGALIFLTISAIVTNNPVDKALRLASIMYGLTIMGIFSLVSYCIVVGNMAWGLKLMKSGFIFIIVVAAVLIILNSIIFNSTKVSLS